jgi:hypothetical protein
MNINIAFQDTIRAWVNKCLGYRSAKNAAERNFRFLEEALELVQANGMTRDEAWETMEYVFARPVGKLPQEVAGTVITLVALANQAGIDVAEEAMVEFRRIDTPEMMAKIRAKQESKPRRVRIDTPGEIADNGYMEVEVGGRIEQRAVSYIDTEAQYGSHRVPVTYAGEVIQWVIGRDTPIILKGKA